MIENISITQYLHEQSLASNHPYHSFLLHMIRATSSERRVVIDWLQKMHRIILLFVFETNILTFAIFAYGLVKTQELLGDPTSARLDGIVKGIVGMSDTLNPSDRGRQVPNTMAQVEGYLKKELSFDTDELLNILGESQKLTSMRDEMEKHRIGKLTRYQ